MDVRVGQATVIEAMRDEMERLPSALARIAAYILENPEKTIRLSVTELGEFSGSGEASVVRMCRLLGFEGFRDFKLALAAELARVVSVVDDAASPGEAAVRRIHAAITHALDTTRDRVGSSAYAELAALLVNARRIDVFGAGVSGMIGEMLAYRLLRLGLTAQAFRDPDFAHEVAIGLDADCVAIAVSESGLTRQTIAFLKAAAVQGARTAALTTRGTSTVAKQADHCLLAASVVTPTVGGAISAVAGMTLAIEVLTLEIQRLRNSIKRN